MKTVFLCVGYVRLHEPGCWKFDDGKDGDIDLGTETGIGHIPMRSIGMVADEFRS